MPSEPIDSGRRLLSRTAILLALTLAAPAISTTADACGAPDIPPFEDGSPAVDAHEAGVEDRSAGRTEAAIRHFEQSMRAEGDLAIRGDSAVAAFRLHVAKGRRDRGLAVLAEAVEIYDGHFPLRLVFGRALLEGEPAHALTHFRAAEDTLFFLRSDPERRRREAQPYPELAMAHARLGDAEAARAALVKALDAGAPAARIRAVEEAIAAEVIASRR